MRQVRVVQTQDLVDAVTSLTREKKKAGKICWSVVWSDKVREWFHKNNLDAGERSDHPGESLSWNGSPWQTADNEAYATGLLHKWKRERERGGWAKREVGWSLPESYDDAAERAEVQGFDRTR